MNPPTEIPKKDIIRVTLQRLGDSDTAWRYLKELGIVRPPQRKFTFTITAEVPEGYVANPAGLSSQQVGRALYHGGFGHPTVDTVENVTEKVAEDPNTGTVSVEAFLNFARTVKRGERYCSEFWNVVENEFGVKRPQLPAMQVSFVLTPANFEAAGVDPDQEVTPDVLRLVLEETGNLAKFSATKVETATN